MGNNNIKTVLLTFILIATGFTVAVVANHFIGEWAFIPLAIVYWTSIFIIVKPTKKKWTTLLVSPHISPKYILLSLVPALFGIVSFAWAYNI